MNCSECNKEIDENNWFEVHHWIKINNRQELENERFCSYKCMKEFGE